MVSVSISIGSVVGGSWSVVCGWSAGGGFVLRHFGKTFVTNFDFSLHDKLEPF